MEDYLSRLEAKVQETIETIQMLRSENTQLKDRCGELKDRCEELESSANDLRNERDRMRQELDDSSATVAQVEQYEEKRRVIEAKVGSLLEKLEAMG